MSYLKYGVVTKIEDLEKEKKNKFINNNFNLDLYNKNKNIYSIKENVLNSNLKPFREEVLSISHYGDSIDSCEAYCLNTTADKLINHDICLVKDDQYYFKDYEDFVFDFEKVYLFTEKASLRINFLSIFWDINKVECEDFIKVSFFLTNTFKKALTNCLKDASLFLEI